MLDRPLVKKAARGRNLFFAGYISQLATLASIWPRLVKGQLLPAFTHLGVSLGGRQKCNWIGQDKRPTIFYYYPDDLARRNATLTLTSVKAPVFAARLYIPLVAQSVE
jgi:hypothetical protein